MELEGHLHLAHLRARNLRPNYIASRRRVLDRFGRYMEPRPLGTATLHDLRDYLNRPLSAESRAVEIAHLRSYYRWAYREGHIGHDPTVRLERPKTKRGQPRPIGARDLSLVLSAAGPLVKPMLALAAYAGLRACEIAPLKGEDLLLDDGIVLVAEGKGGVPGSVPASPDLTAILANLPRRGWCFPRLDGRPGHLSRVRISQLCNGHMRDVGVDATLHQLRHFFGTQIYGATRDLRLTQKLMRHATSSTTDLYTYLADEAGAQAVASLPRLT